ncbi:UNVERIFIED_CONTAM: hypothetical protein KB579_02640 [Streptococcus canis]
MKTPWNALECLGMPWNAWGAIGSKLVSIVGSKEVGVKQLLWGFLDFT